MKLLIYLLVGAFLFNSCIFQSDESLIDKYSSIYQNDIHLMINKANELQILNEQKFNQFHRLVSETQRKFDTAYIKINEGPTDLESFYNELLALVDSNKIIQNRIAALTETDWNKLNKKERNAYLLELNSTVLRELYNNVHLNELRINKVNVIVIPEKRTIALGETYNAKLLVVAIDTLTNPFIKVGDQIINTNNGIGNIQIKSGKRGKNEFTGTLDLVNYGDGFLRTFPFKVEFNVE